jgi:hypothetical protein
VKEALQRVASLHFRAGTNSLAQKIVAESEAIGAAVGVAAGVAKSSIDDAMDK